MFWSRKWFLVGFLVVFAAFFFGMLLTFQRDDHQVGSQGLLVFLSLSVFLVAAILIGYFGPFWGTEKKEKERPNQNEEPPKEPQKNASFHLEKDSTLKELEALREREEYRREFLGNVSHELKTPIFSIQGFLETLMDGAIEDEEVRDQYLIRASRNVERLISIVNDLEQISSIEAGQLKLEKTVFDLRTLVKENIQNFEGTAQKQDHKLAMGYGFSKETPVYADPNQISKVLSNLITNSIKYSKPNGETIISLSDADGKAVVAVMDNGLGIKEEDMPRIFERFFRVDKSRSRFWAGTGLGLSIVKHIIEAHGESISVESVFGEGSTFRFSLGLA